MILQNLKKEPMNVIEFDSLMRYIQDMKTVYPKIEGRVTLLNMKTLNGTVSASASHPIVSVLIICFFSVIALFNYNEIKC